jgi:hypothetical protein
MPWNDPGNHQRRIAGLLGALALLACSGPAGATILLFDQSRDAVSQTIVEPTVGGDSLPQDYGDRAAGAVQDVLGGQFTYGNGGEGFTPNIVVDYFIDNPSMGPGLALWETDFGDLTNVAFGGNSSGGFNILFTADPGFDVLLYGFDLGGWPATDYTIASVSVFDGTTFLFSQADVLVEGDATGPPHSTFSFADPLVGAQLLLHIDYSNLDVGSHDNIGIDNIRFGQDRLATAVVPEPSTALLLTVGMGLATIGRLRRRGAS